MGLALLERYVFRKAMIVLLISLGALIGVVWIARALMEVNIVTTKGQGLLTYFQMISLGVPTLAAAVAPIALLIAFLQVVRGLNTDSELVVMHAAGANRRTLLKPFMALAILIAALVYLLSLWVGPASMRTLRSYVNDMRADLVSVAIREGTFRDAGHGLTFHVASRKPGGVLSSVYIFDTRNKDETLTYVAREGILTEHEGNSLLVLKDGQIQRSERGSDNISVIDFNSYSFNLSTFEGGSAVKLYSQMEIPTYELFHPDPEERLYKTRPGRYRAELHIRFTSGLYPIATALIVVALLGFPQSHRQGQTQAIFKAAAAVVALRAAGIAVEDAARTQTWAVIMLWVIPVGGILIASLYLAAGKTLRLPQSVRMPIQKLNETIIESLRRLAQSRLIPASLRLSPQREGMV